MRPALALLLTAAFMTSISCGLGPSRSLPALSWPQLLTLPDRSGFARPLAGEAGALVASTVYVVGGARTPGEIAAMNRCFFFAIAGHQRTSEEIEP